MAHKSVTSLVVATLAALFAAGWTGTAIGEEVRTGWDWDYGQGDMTKARDGSCGTCDPTLEEVLVGIMAADIGERNHPQAPASHRVTKQDRIQDTTQGDPNPNPTEARNWYMPHP
jgi:hypothetical protein